MFQVTSSFRPISLRGSHFECGFKLGKEKQKQVRQYINLERKSLLTARRKQKSLIAFLLSKLRREYPNIINELRGMSLGAGVDFNDLFLTNCPELRESLGGGCTSAAVKRRDSAFIIHNEDEDSRLTRKNFALISYDFKNSSYTSFTLLGELSGPAFNWNSRGLFYCVNNLPYFKINPRYTPKLFVARALLEKKTLAEALSFLKKVDSAAGFHYLLGEANSQKIVSVEKFLRGASVKYIHNYYYHTNHYLHPKYLAQIKKRGRNSVKRLNILQQNFRPDMSPSEAERLWSSKLNQRNLEKHNDSKTFATVTADLKNRRVTIV